METTWSLLTKKVLQCWQAVVLCALLLLNTNRAWATVDATRVAGYEAFPGLPCQIEGADGACGVRFYGWLGGAGAVPDGWVAYTGNGRVVVRLDYAGDPALGSRVTITGGTWRLTDHGVMDAGTIDRGTVTWPTATEDIGCGVGIATVAATLAEGEFSHFTGCLHDFDAEGQVAIPPKIWGSFE